MLVMKMSNKSFCKLKERIRRLLMYLKGILMTCLGKKDWGRFKNDPNPKVEILERKCLFHCRLFILAGQVFIVSDGDKYANIVKAQVMFLEFCINVTRVGVVEKWWEKLMSRVKWNRLRWNVKNVMAVDTRASKSVQYAMAKR